MGMSSRRYSPMRILIADPKDETRTSIDRLLVAFGYFSVCPVTSFAELTALTHYTPAINERFDLLIVSANLLTHANIDAVKFCVDNSRLKHVLLYGAPDLMTMNGGALSDEPQRRVLALASLDYGRLIQFVNAVDPENFTYCRAGIPTAKIAVRPSSNTVP